MMKRIIPISLWSFSVGLVVQFLFCCLYISSLIKGLDLSLLFILSLYLISETLLIGLFLFFAVTVPAGSLLLRWLKKEDPRYYPLSVLFLCLLLTGVVSGWTGYFDWLLSAFLFPAAFIFGGLWWNRIELEGYIPASAA
ncbi:hypothetical protein [Salinithrix halophila]|uniref:Uncharacterized protein n=1 Tax=Salinithrix halophila TaxID=1485204 RepID=A0ABV8JBG9_9BACL